MINSEYLDNVVSFHQLFHPSDLNIQKLIPELMKSHDSTDNFPSVKVK